MLRARQKMVEIIRKENKEGAEESEFEVNDFFDINMIKVAKTRPKGGIMQVGAIPNGRDKRDETGIDSDAMVSVSEFTCPTPR